MVTIELSRIMLRHTAERNVFDAHQVQQLLGA